MSTVVLVHGAAMDGTVWQYQADALAREGFSSVAVDLPGHGDSGGEPSVTIRGYAGWLLAYLSVLDEAVHLVGHSMGALVILEAAAARPDRVRSLTLLGVADRMPVNPDLLAGTAVGESASLTTMASWMHARRPVGAPEWQIDDTAAILLRSRPGIAYADLTACNDYPGAADVAAALSVPMLLILGDQDLMTKTTAAEPIANAAPDATTVIVEDAGHMLMVERPDVINEVLLEFLREVQGKSKGSRREVESRE